jgi:hypothetical protein
MHVPPFSLDEQLRQLGDRLDEAVSQVLRSGQYIGGSTIATFEAAFAEACAAAGIEFIGPTPAQLRDFGLKHTARALADQCGMPLLPGTGLLADVDAALQAAATIGYPVMLKSTAGGGGIGMQACRDDAELRTAFLGAERGCQQGREGDEGEGAGGESTLVHAHASGWSCPRDPRVGETLPRTPGNLAPGLAAPRVLRSHGGLHGRRA